MMRLTMIILLILIFASCKNEDAKIMDAEEVPVVFPDTILVWETNADSMIMKRDPIIPDSVITINRVINGLNEKYPEVQLVVLKHSNDTLYVRIPQGEYLGNQMGSFGASAWFADATINLTAVPGINFVSFIMDTFSHAASTIIGREQYKTWQKQ